MQTNIAYNESAEIFLPKIADASIDLTVTSPPYDNMRTYKGFSWDFELIAKHLYRVLKPGGVCVWVVRDQIKDYSETLTRMRQALYFVDEVGFKMHQTIVWHRRGTIFPDRTRYTRNAEYCYILSKGRPKTINLQVRANKWPGDSHTPTATTARYNNDGSRTVKKRNPVKSHSPYIDVWPIEAGHMKSTKDKCAFGHPAIMPEKLAERHVLTWSNPGDVVLDPFLGSGTTAKMAALHNRQWVGCELSPDYFRLIQERLSLPVQPSLLGG
jgi:site-specific DNA-methyltransferase (adenine-specific)